MGGKLDVLAANEAFIKYRCKIEGFQYSHDKEVDELSKKLQQTGVNYEDQD